MVQGGVLLNAGYVREPDISRHPEGVLKSSLDLVCNYTGSDKDGQFVDWLKDGVSVSTEKAGHYKVHHSGKASVLSIKIFGKSTCTRTGTGATKAMLQYKPMRT